jgi:Flp pilus assembly protein TadG
MTSFKDNQAPRSPEGRFAPVLSRFVRDDGGVAVVEFALILPILLVLWIGGVEVTSALSVDRRLNNLASSIGDLVSRSKSVTYSEVDNIFNIAPGAMYPYSNTGLSMRITAVKMDANGAATVAWSRAKGTKPAYTENSNMNGIVPATLRVRNSQVILSEVYFSYSPAVGYVITGPLALEDRMFFVPRLVSAVQLCDNRNPPTCKS